MRILIAHNRYKQAGGEDTQVAAEAALLRHYGHAVSLWQEHNDSMVGPMASMHAAARASYSLKSARTLRKEIASFRPDVIHIHNFFPLISPSAHYCAQQARVPVVQTLHNFRLVCPNALLYRNGSTCELCLGTTFAWRAVAHGCYRGSRLASAAVSSMLLLHRLLSTWTRQVDVFIALTQFARGKLIAGGLPPEKIAVKPNFVYPEPGLGQGNGDYALYVGRLSSEKGITVLLAALRRLGGGFPLKIAGNGPLAALVAESARQSPNIEWLGEIPIEAVYQLMGDARCVIVPSTCFEAFGRVVIEAFAKGVPVIAARIGSLPELVEHGRTGLLFTPGDDQELAEQVRSLFSADRAAMASAARLEYENKYTGPRNHEMLMAVYEQAIATSSQRIGGRECTPDEAMMTNASYRK